MTRTRIFSFVSAIVLSTVVTPIFGQVITTVAGGATGHGGYWGEGGLATMCQLERAGAVAIDSHGNIYIGDRSRVLKVNQTTGIISTIAGTGVLGYNGDGIPATSALLNMASYMDVDSVNNLFIGDGLNIRVRKVDAGTGLISTHVGTGILGSSGDGGPATAANIAGCDFSWDNAGNLIIGCSRKIRKIDVSGTITTIAGTGMYGVTGEGVPAITTNISTPIGIAVDRYNNIFFSDTTGAVRKIDASTGIVTRVAGTGDNIRSPYSGDGIPASTCHISPLGIHIDGQNNLYIADGVNNRVILVDTFGITHTIAGTGISGYSGDGGPATAARLLAPQVVKTDVCGNIYIADYGNYRIRKVTMPPVLTIPVISVAVPGESAPIPIGTTVTVTATVSSAGSSYLIRWMNRGIEFATTTVPTVTYTKGPGTDTITARVVSTASYGCYDSTTSAPHYVHEGTVGVAYAPAMATNLRLYPNPAYTQLTITTTEPITNLSITNVLGQVVAAPPGLPRGEVTVPVGHLPKGVYLVRVNGVYVQRFVKE